MEYSITSIAEIIAAKADFNDKNALISDLIIDSRKIIFPGNSLFFALKGKNRDGSKFLKDALEKGVRNFVVERPPKGLIKSQCNILQVTNSLFALQKLAAHHRHQYDIPLIAITGSNGKTIVKEWLHQLLSAEKKIVRSPKSYNSQVGVPLSVWQIAPNHDLAIFEAGISQPDEMGKLEKILHPTIGVFTNIGSAHDEGFNNRQEKANEKLKLFSRSELLIYRNDYKEMEVGINALKKSNTQLRCISWGNTGNAVYKVRLHPSAEQTLVTLESASEKYRFSIPFTEEASIENAIHCIVVMIILRIPKNIIQERVRTLRNLPLRLELKKALNGCSLIYDCYNSDLNGLRIALNFLAQQQQHSKKSIILSDIEQSGLPDEELYGQVADMTGQQELERFIGIGEKISLHKALFREIAKNVSFYPSTTELLHNLIEPEFSNETILLKGARSFEFEKVGRILEQKAHETVLEIKLNALVHNMNVYHSLIKSTTKLMVMVKAFSYGSGSYEVANILQFQKADYLAVAYADEGKELRKAGIELPIMVLNTNTESFQDLLRYNLEPEIYSPKLLLAFNQFLNQYADKRNKPFPIHIKLDTGMHRLGFEEQHIEFLIKRLQSCKHSLKVQSIFSHLAASEDSGEDTFTQKQLRLFEQMYKQLANSLGYSPLKHILNSAAIVRFPQYQFDMVRLGIGLYGFDPSGVIQGRLENISELTTFISQIKNLKAGDTVGYSRAGKVENESVIATIGIGYADGISRRMGQGVGKMLVKGQYAPIVGNVCMDMCMLDISAIKGVKEGDKVIVFNEELPVQQWSEWEGTVPYEIFTRISERVKRVYFEE